MSNETSTLEHVEILELRAAVISANLTGSRPALMAHISADFVSTLPLALVPGEQVLMDIAALHAAGELADGSVPLAAWLMNAVQLCGRRREGKVFTKVLERVRPGAATRVGVQEGPDSQKYEPAAPAIPGAGALPAVTTSRAELREMITQILRSDSDFDAFVLDHFEDVHRRFSNGMDRVAKVTLLFQHVATKDILEGLESERRLR